jgi:hypothetical protein
MTANSPTTAHRTWIGTAGRAIPREPWETGQDCGCADDQDYCRCPRIIEIPITTADGRTVVARMTPDEADAYARQIQTAVEFARVAVL